MNTPETKKVNFLESGECEDFINSILEKVDYRSGIIAEYIENSNPIMHHGESLQEVQLKIKEKLSKKVSLEKKVNDITNEILSLLNYNIELLSLFVNLHININYEHYETCSIIRDEIKNTLISKK